MSKKISVFISLIALLFLGGCSLMQIVQPFLGSGISATPTNEPTFTTSLQTVDQKNLTTLDAEVVAIVQETFQTIYTKVNPSVVNIQVTQSYGWSSGTSQGSGFVWDENGNIVTNNHVIDGANNISVVFSDGSSTAAQVVGADPQSDLAVIRVDPKGLTLIPVELGDSLSVKVGDLVIAIGNPYGLSGTMTQGIVSALSRSITVDQSSMYSQTTYTIPDIIQTDAAINPGNSGGVLVNVSGEVIGVTSAIQSSTNSNAGIGFVIPAHIFNRVVPVLISDGKYQHPGLGLNGYTMTPAIAADMNLKGDTKGILIIDITRGGAADAAGLVRSVQQLVAPGRVSVTYGDVITAVNGRATRTYEDLLSYLFNKTEVGQTITLTVIRDGKEITVDLKLQGE